MNEPKTDTSAMPAASQTSQRIVRREKWRTRVTNARNHPASYVKDFNDVYTYLVSRFFLAVPALRVTASARGD